MSVHEERNYAGQRDNMINLVDMIIWDDHLLEWVPLGEMYFGVLAINGSRVKLYTQDVKIKNNGAQDHMINIGPYQFTSGYSYKIVSCISNVATSGGSYERVYSLRYNFPGNVSDSVKTLTAQSQSGPVKLIAVEWINPDNYGGNSQFYCEGLRFIFDTSRYSYVTTYSVIIEGDLIEDSGMERLGNFKVNKDSGYYEYESLKEFSFLTYEQDGYVLMTVYTVGSNPVKVLEQKTWVGLGKPDFPP